MALSNGLARATVEGGKSLAQVKQWFFDRDKVQKAADRATLIALNRVGGTVRKVAQRSMRYRKGASAPGQPPSAHRNGRQGTGRAAKSKYTGAWLREFLFYAYDPLTRTVVVGPLGFKKSTVPALHEFGGEQDKVQWRTVDGKRVLVKIGTTTYPARPYMRPALAAVIPKFADQFRGTIGG